MKRLVLAGVGALAMVTLMGAANAADLPRRHAMPTKAPMYEQAYNWTG
ncbi:MAG: porin family protein, partial [Rhodopseudomonas sp.]|nr:porin family protein [Rhodopseudomonas sp.]